MTFRRSTCRHSGRRFAHEHQVSHTAGFETGGAAISSPSEGFSHYYGAVPRGQVARKVTSQRCTRTPSELLLHCEIQPLGAGHRGWEDKAEENGSRVVDWVIGGYKRVAR